MDISHIDHIVLTVKNIEETVRFYRIVLGMNVRTDARGRISLVFGRQKINLHPQGGEIDPAANVPMPGAQDVCFMTKTPLEKAMAHVKNMGVPIIEGPVARAGARHSILSFYFRDPDGNLIEIANDTETSPSASPGV